MKSKRRSCEVECRMSEKKEMNERRQRMKKEEGMECKGMEWGKWQRQQQKVKLFTNKGGGEVSQGVANGN